MRPARPNRAWDMGVVLAVPWPPLGVTIASDPTPLVMGPEGVGSLGEDAPFWPWEGVMSTGVTARTVTVNGQALCRTTSARLARDLAELLREAAALPERARRRRLERFFDQRFEAEEVLKRLRIHRRALWPLCLVVNLLWLGMAVGIPLLVYTALVQYWLELVGSLLLLWLLGVVLFFRALRRHPLVPRDLWPDGVHRFFAAASPLSVLRAPDLMAREVASELDPLALGAVLLPPASFRDQARRALAELRWRSGASDSPEPRACASAWMARTLHSRVQRLLKARGIDEDEVMAPPRRNDPRSHAYCPRCLAQYLSGERCTSDECGDLPLVRFQV